MAAIFRGGDELNYVPFLACTYISICVLVRLVKLDILVPSAHMDTRLTPYLLPVRTPRSPRTWTQRYRPFADCSLFIQWQKTRNIETPRSHWDVLNKWKGNIWMAVFWTQRDRSAMRDHTQMPWRENYEMLLLLRCKIAGLIWTICVMPPLVFWHVQTVFKSFSCNFATLCAFINSMQWAVFLRGIWLRNLLFYLGLTQTSPRDLPPRFTTQKQILVYCEIEHFEVKYYVSKARFSG